MDRSVKKQGEPLPGATVVCTIGHSTRPIEEFIALLQAHEITQLVDVRTVPRSRHNPQFNKEQLPISLHEVGIRYSHIAGLGGLRRRQPDSINGGWRNASFRAYADYMQTAEFAENLNQLMTLAAIERCALMCAEAVPWRCHRSLIADALVVRGVRVDEIISLTSCRPHRLTSFAKLDGMQITYPSDTVEAGDQS